MGEKRRRISLSYFLEELTGAGSLSLSRSAIDCCEDVHFGIFFFSLLLFFLSLSPSLPHFLPRLRVSLSLSLSLSLSTKISVARRDFFFSHLSLFRKLFPSFSFTFKGFMVLSVVDTNMEKVQDRWRNKEVLTRNTYPRSQLDECCREK